MVVSNRLTLTNMSTGIATQWLSSFSIWNKTFQNMGSPQRQNICCLPKHFCLSPGQPTLLQWIYPCAIETSSCVSFNSHVFNNSPPADWCLWKQTVLCSGRLEVSTSIQKSMTKPFGWHWSMSRGINLKGFECVWTDHTGLRCLTVSFRETQDD